MQHNIPNYFQIQTTSSMEPSNHERVLLLILTQSFNLQTLFLLWKPERLQNLLFFLPFSKISKFGRFLYVLQIWPISLLQGTQMLRNYWQITAKRGHILQFLPHSLLFCSTNALEFIYKTPSVLIKVVFNTQLLFHNHSCCGSAITSHTRLAILQQCQGRKKANIINSIFSLKEGSMWDTQP